MILFRFSGWFQTRFATDPDPVDEPRGISGYMRCLPGEPDFDRLVRLQPAGTVNRLFMPKIGVTVSQVVVNGSPDPRHTLLGATVDLLDQPKFWGHNGIVADDGVEPIIPFHIQVAKDGFLLARQYAEKYEFPFTELLARNGIIPSATDNAEATGIWDIRAHLDERKKKLEEELKKAEDDVTKDVLQRRIAFLGSPAATRYFTFRMYWTLPLQGKITAKGVDGVLPDKPSEKPWRVDFWMGAWDPDTACGFMAGGLRLP